MKIKKTTISLVIGLSQIFCNNATAQDSQKPWSPEQIGEYSANCSVAYTVIKQYLPKEMTQTDENAHSYFIALGYRNIGRDKFSQIFQSTAQGTVREIERLKAYSQILSSNKIEYLKFLHMVRTVKGDCTASYSALTK